MPPTLTRHQRHPPQPRYTCQSTTPHQNDTHASTLPTLARHPRQCAIHASTPTTPTTLARYPRKHATQASRASTNSTPFLKLKKTKTRKVIKQITNIEKAQCLNNFTKNIIQNYDNQTVEAFNSLLLPRGKSKKNFFRLRCSSRLKLRYIKGVQGPIN